MMRLGSGKHAGFTLLEAMVAISILATTSLAIYSWYSTSLLTLERTENVAEQAMLRGDLQAFLATVNLQQEGRQEFRINAYTVVLDASLLEPVQDSRTITSAPGLYEVGLYSVVVNVYRDGRQLGDFATRLVGYRQVRQP